MIQGRCPTCKKTFQTPSIDDLPSFPFCTERCRLVDLGRWLDGAYVIPGEPVPDASEPTNPGAEDDEDDDG